MPSLGATATARCEIVSRLSSPRRVLLPSSSCNASEAGLKARLPLCDLLFAESAARWARAGKRLQSMNRDEDPYEKSYAADELE